MQAHQFLSASHVCESCGGEQESRATSDSRKSCGCVQRAPMYELCILRNTCRTFKVTDFAGRQKNAFHSRRPGGCGSGFHDGTLHPYTFHHLVTKDSWTGLSARSLLKVRRGFDRLSAAYPLESETHCCLPRWAWLRKTATAFPEVPAPKHPTTQISVVASLASRDREALVNPAFPLVIVLRIHHHAPGIEAALNAEHAPNLPRG